MKRILCSLILAMFMLIPIAVLAEDEVSVTISCNPEKAKAGENITCNIIANSPFKITQYDLNIDVSEGLEISDTVKSEDWISNFTNGRSVSLAAEPQMGTYNLYTMYVKAAVDGTYTLSGSGKATDEASTEYNVDVRGLNIVIGDNENTDTEEDTTPTNTNTTNTANTENKNPETGAKEFALAAALLALFGFALVRNTRKYFN